jgi:hypothetical protein
MSKITRHELATESLTIPNYHRTDIVPKAHRRMVSLTKTKQYAEKLCKDG